MPIITDKIPSSCKKLVAGDIMQPDPISLKSVDTMKNIKRAITYTEHRAFPIVNDDNYLIGIIPRNFIITLIEHENFYSTIARKSLNESDIRVSVIQAENNLK